MAGTINYLYDPNQEVYVIDTCEAKAYVIAGVVLRARAQVHIGATELKYDVRLERNRGTKEFAEVDIFADSASAVAEYEIRIT